MARSGLVVLTLWFCGLVAGCHSVGPTLIERDHFDYNASIANSWKEQMLLNMIRLRYGEAPVFLDVASVIAQYSLEGQVSVNSAGWDRPNNVGPPIGSGAARWIDRPTITYQPRTGEVLARTLLQPLQLSAIFSLVQGGWPLDLTLAMTLRSLNGFAAYTRRGAVQWNPNFLKAVDALAAMNELDAGGVIIVDGQPIYKLTEGSLSPDVVAAQRQFRGALALDPDTSEYAIVVSPRRSSNRELALSTASTLDVLNVLASRFEVPEEHVARGWTFATPAGTPGYGRDARPPPIWVHSGDEPPAQAFVATQNRGAWFWIDDGDFESKRTFSLITMILALSETASNASPVVTVGAGG